MQETFDFYTLIIVITFLGGLLFLAYFVNKKKEFFKSHINKNKSIDIISSSLLGGGNRVILFEVDHDRFLVVSNKSNLSNILRLENNQSNNISQSKS
jgi:flagellar biogenesis protein FliO